MTGRRALTWAVVGAAAAAGVMLKDLSLLLSEIQTGASRSYGAGAFNGLHPAFWDTQSLRDAIEVWALAADVARTVLTWHVWLDLLVFIPAFAVVLAMVLRASTAARGFATWAAIVYGALDLAETVVTALVVPSLVDPTKVPIPQSPGLVAIQLLALVKWMVLLVVVVVAAVGLIRRLRAAPQDDSHGYVGRARSGGEQAPALALGWIVALVALFAALVALPAGGALDQIPDVIRQHLAEGGPWLWTLSTLGLLLLFAAVVVAGLAATSPGGRTAPDAKAPVWVVPAVAAGASLLFVVWSWLTDDGMRIGLFTPLIVVGALWVASLIARWARVAAPEPHPPSVPELETWRNESVLWVGGLAAVVAIAGALGLVRAAFPPWVLGIDDGRFPWWTAAVGGFAGALAAGAAAQAAVSYLARRGSAVHRAAGSAVVVAVVGAAAALAVVPEWGRSWGSTGVVGVGLGFWALVIGALIWLSRTRPHWDVTRLLGFGARTPWFTLLLVTGLVGSMLNKDAGYHDARVLDEPHVPRHTSLDGAVTSWKEAVIACGPEPGEPVPMVFVAAPGGGIRAAYWTVSVLEKVFPGRCSAAHVFAISGVSGGSVGAATWVTARGETESPLDAVTAMSEDAALPATIAGLLLRDIPEPLTGLVKAWDDRAALMERGWTEAAGIFGSNDDPLPFSRAGDGRGLSFVPVLALNGSSVTDACRVLVTNTARLPASEGPDCQGVPSPGNSVSGPESGTIDAFAGLHARGSGACGEATVDVPITTAALLSARFPFVSPSGILERCVRTGETDEEISTFVVDGGYYENSGLLTLLQLWEGVDETIDEALPLNPVQPWFLLVDNHYRATAKKVPPGDPMELFVPLKGSQQKVLTQTMLEQAAIWEMDDSGLPPRFVYLAPTTRPGVEAPLGWVLSSVSRDDLHRQLDEQYEAQAKDPDSPLGRLLELLP